MKKLPVLLLSLTLASVWPVNSVEASGVTEWPVENVYDSRFHIQTIKPREGTVEIELDTMLEPDLKAQRVWLATVDYEKGWTEAEVDARLGDWTELEAEWALVTKEQLLPNLFSHAYVTIRLTIDSSVLGYDLTQVNLLDVLYYAVEFEDLGNEDAEPIWVRGKVDYRGCVHAERFERWETGACVEMIDWEARTVKYLALDATEEEEVITWEEEWRKVLAGRLSEVATVLDGLAMLTEVAEDDLAAQEEKLLGIEKLLLKESGVEGELTEVTLLRERIEALRHWKDESEGGDDSGSKDDSTTKVPETEEKPDEGQGDDSGVEDSGSEDSGVGASSIEAVLPREEVSSGVVSGGVSFVGGEKVVASEAIEDSGDVLDDTEEIVREIEMEEVEVPKLGGARERNGWIWWMLSLSGALSVFFVAVLRRKRSKK